jgi:hypothetical protein
MIQVHEKETGVFLGTITDAQLQFLIDQLEEESTDWPRVRELLEQLLEEGILQYAEAHEPDSMATQSGGLPLLSGVGFFQEWP